MSRKHYERAARLVRETRKFGSTQERAAVGLLVENFVELFQPERGFNESRFRNACNKVAS